MNTAVSVVPCASYDPGLCRQALLQVLAPLGGLDWVKEGMRIVIKANLVSFLKPEAAATTHPQLLCQLVQLLRERGARVIVGDSPGGLYNAAYVGQVYRATGMHLVEEVGGQLNYDFSQAPASFPQARVAKDFFYTRYLDDADVIINFCKLKTHAMMGMSAGVKNLFGIIPGTMKPEYHFRFPNGADFARMLVDLNDYLKPSLILCDAVTAMEGNGPTMGSARHMGALVASQNPHALDLVCAHMIGLKPEQVPTLQAAQELGYIPESHNQLEIFGPLESLCVQDFDLIKTPGSLLFQNPQGGVFGKLKGKIIQRAMCSIPKVEADKCIGCGHCQRICPAKAIQLKNKLPRIDRSACIHCFCCQEFCPKGAIHSYRPVIAKLLGGNG